MTCGRNNFLPLYVRTLTWTSRVINHLSDSEISPYQPGLGPHLEYEQMDGYVDDTIGPLERRKILAHTRECPMCAGKLQDRESHRARMLAVLGPGNSAARQWHSLTTLWGQPAVMAVAAVIVLAVGCSGWWLQGWHSDIQPQAVPTTEPRRDDISFAQSLGVLRGSDQALLGSAVTPTASLRLEPVGEWVRQTTPLLHWSAFPGAATYSVAIFDDHVNLIEASPLLQETQWQVDAVLERGRVYLWQVTVTDKDGNVVSIPSPPVPDARFGVLAEAQAVELEQAEYTHPEAHLDLGILYARDGLLKDAQQEFLKVTPSDADFAYAQRLLATLGSLRAGAGSYTELTSP